MSQNTTILIAEDSSVILSLTRKILQLQNYNILTAKNGREVLQRVEESNIDLILLDINIPIMNGMDVARSIRSHANKQVAKTPIVAITGNANNYSMEQFKEAGIDDYLPKPLDFDQLVETVKRYTNNS